MKKKTQRPPRTETDPAVGLRSAEVAARRAAGMTNRAKSKTGKSYFRIVADNLFTYFNLIWAVIIGVLIAVGAYGDLLFSAIIVANTALAIFGEVRAKRTVEKLSMLTSPRVRVMRDGTMTEIAAEEVVTDDIVILGAGNQVPADLIVVEGTPEVNESLLTGESDGVKKAPGDMLLAGSFLISGGCAARAERVGNEAYIQTVAVKAKAFKASESYLFRDIRKIVRGIGILIIPFAVLSFLNNHAALPVPAALRRTAASLAGMIPAGMFLLITVALSMGVIRLARRKTMVKDPYSIEMLARTDVLCLDKTGTITDGTMQVCGEWVFAPVKGVEVAAVMAASLAVQPDSNFTSAALRAYYTESGGLVPCANLPFSSKRKCTATSFTGFGTFAYGAPEFLHVGTLDPAVAARIEKEAAAGRRVLMLAHSPEQMEEESLPGVMYPVALILLEDHIREEAYETVRWFRENRVTVKIISGDNPLTVSAIAARVGVENADRYLSLDGLSPEEAAQHAEEYTVFGRVTPEQKHALIAALRKAGHVVSMTGDGVNDTLALKEADCSIAMAGGSEAARGLSNIVLLDNNFASLPSVVREGRRVVNNVERSSTLFLMKTFFALSLSLICILTHTPYPYLTKGILLFEVFVDGIPSVILALQNNYQLIEGRFISGVLKRCLPFGCLLLISVVSVIVLHSFGFYADMEYLTLCVLALTGSGFVALFSLCLPLNRIRIGCILFSAVGIFASLLIYPSYFGVTVINGKVLISLLVILLLSYPLLRVLEWLFDAVWRLDFRKKKKAG